MSGYLLGSPELRQHVHEVVEFALWCGNPGVWFDYPETGIHLTRESFLLYDVQGDPETGRVQIRRKSAAPPLPRTCTVCGQAHIDIPGQAIEAFRLKAAAHGWVEDPLLTFTDARDPHPRIQITVDADGRIVRARSFRR